MAEILTTRKNLKSLTDLLAKWIDRAGGRRSLDKLILDLNRLSCIGCHIPVEGTDWVYVQGYAALKKKD